MKILMKIAPIKFKKQTNQLKVKQTTKYITQSIALLKLRLCPACFDLSNCFDIVILDSLTSG